MVIPNSTTKYFLLKYVLFAHDTDSLFFDPTSRQLHPTTRFYRWTGKNQYIMMGKKDSIVIGGGGYVLKGGDAVMIFSHRNPMIS